MTDDSRRVITATEAQASLGIPASTVRSWAWRGKLHAVSIGEDGQSWYRLEDVLALASLRRSTA